MEFISLKEVLDTMDAGHTFSIKFVTADKRLKSGGEWKHYEHARKHVQAVATHTAKPSAGKVELAYMVKNPKHFENSTRNIRKVNGEIRTVHIRLIREFNGRTVL